MIELDKKEILGVQLGLFETRSLAADSFINKNRAVCSFEDLLKIITNSLFWYPYVFTTQNEKTSKLYGTQKSVIQRFKDYFERLR